MDYETTNCLYKYAMRVIDRGCCSDGPIVAVEQGGSGVPIVLTIKEWRELLAHIEDYELTTNEI